MLHAPLHALARNILTMAPHWTRQELDLSRQGLSEARFPISVRRLWRAPGPLAVYSRSDDLGPPAVKVLPEGFPVSTGMVGRMLDFLFRAGSSGVFRP